MSRIFKPRTGNQYSISFGDYSAVVTELGATLRALRWKGKNLLATFDANETVPCCNGYVLVPYPNRVEDGTYTFNGATYHMPIDEPDRMTSLHGFGYRYFWTLENLTESSVTLSWRAPAIPSYPFDITVYAHYELSDAGLSQSVTVENNDDKPAPWAFGIHPWLANGVEGHTGDEIEEDNAACHLELHAAKHVTVSPDRLLPTGLEDAAGTKYDLASNPSFEGKGYDDAWTDVEHVGDGSTTATFTRPDGIQVLLSGDATVNSWQVCTGTGFGADFRPAGVAVEPMTAHANAFRTGENLETVEPGESYSTTITYVARQI
ncbi:MAG: aldose 1-epimerase family protein [Bifidobacteriaceae bacterium]|jgi:aldose 1-epimerase|nr:aldose 1-epimerase family protein [Bifidobacteriaceae bacterium]